MKQKFKNTIEVTRNSYKDEGEGVVSFPNGLCISDNQVQRNGSRYDIDSLDISKYAGQLTADHEDKLSNIIGRVEGVKKENGRVTVDKIVYAVKQNPYARLAYDLLVGGFSKAFSTETIGAGADGSDGTLRNHELVGLSQVVCPNNYSAIINSVRNSLKTAEADGLDINGVEEELLNSFDKETNMDEENKTIEEKDIETVETPETEEKEVAENQATVVENEATDTEVEETTEEESEKEPEQADEEKEEVENDATEVKEEEAKEPEEAKEIEEEDNEISDEQVAQLFDKIDGLIDMVKDFTGAEEDTDEKGVEEIVVDDLNEVDEKVENKKEETMDKEQIQNAVAEALKGYFANDAKAPEFKKDENSASYAEMDWKERYNKQVNSAYEAFRNGSIAARQTLNEINEANFNALKEAKIVKNSMTIASMGNFVIAPEMYNEIVGQRTDYSAIINATEWKETDSLEFAWLKRNGDIDMQNVAMCDDGKNGNLKPISEYSAEPVTSKLEEMAAVTVVCNAATRFFAVDLLSDVAAGYRNDYDRKRAQLIVARLEQAVEESGQSVDYAPTTDTEAMVTWLESIAEISDTTVNGTLLFNNKTFAKLKAHALEAGANGPLSSIFIDGEIPRIFGMPYIVLPNDLLPTIEEGEKVAFTVDGKEVEIKHAVFYADLSQFTGRTSGGLQYDISADASYEVNGTVRSAYQRNELVLRGSFFRGGAVKDTSRVAGILAKGTES